MLLLSLCCCCCYNSYYFYNTAEGHILEKGQNPGGISIPPAEPVFIYLLQDMARFAFLVVLAIATAGRTMAQEVSTMGPAAFLWPPDRAYSAAWDNTAPCGSSAGVENRTLFPLSMFLRLYCSGVYTK
jgi:hypothetical protein